LKRSVNKGLNLQANILLIFSPIDLENKWVRDTIEDDKINIYLICKRKKIFFNPEEISSNKSLSGLYYLDDNHEKIDINIPKEANVKINSLENGFFNVDQKEEKGIVVKDFLFINKMFQLVNDPIGNSLQANLPSDLEVMYVGQTYGRNGSNKIDRRLENHKKIQKIALDILHKGSNEDILIIGISTSVFFHNTTIIAGNISLLNSEILNSKKRSNETRSYTITGCQELTIFEAALINYFKPEFNKEYKNSFPSSSFKSYEDLYKQDLDYFMVLLDTFSIKCRLFSKFIQDRQYIHTTDFSLESSNKKESFFEFLYSKKR
jgi:hypothetical protein